MFEGKKKEKKWRSLDHLVARRCDAGDDAAGARLEQVAALPLPLLPRG